MLLLTAACTNGGEVAVDDIPKHTPKPTSTPAAPVLTEPSGVFTNWSHLTEYEPPESLYTRLQDAPMETLRPSDSYGRLLQFEGEALYSTGDYGWQAGSKYGLVTMTGCIVLDPVCSNIYRLSTYDYMRRTTTYQDLYVLEKVVYDPDMEYDEWTQGYTTMYALAALDGSWATDFEFCSIYSCELGAVCVLDQEENIAVCYDGTGTVVFDTRNWAIRERMADYGLYGLTYFSDGYALVALEDGGYVFVDPQGEVLDIAGTDGGRVNYASGFSCGLAAAAPAGDAGTGYIDTTGRWVLEPQYQHGGDFINDRAVVTSAEGKNYAIDTSGRRLYEFPGNTYLELDEEGNCCYSLYDPDYGTKYYDENFQLITIGGQPAEPWYGMGYVVRSDAGITALVKGEELFFPGVDNVVRVGELFLTWTYDEDYSMGRSALVDSGQNVLMELENGSLGVVTDTVTGERYLTVTTSAGGQSLCSMTGELLVSDYTYGEPADGLVPCRDAVSTGYKNLQNEWVFRYLVDISD